MARTNNKIGAVDLFCGAGGLAHGLVLGGITVHAGVDANPWCRYPTEKNNEGCTFVEKDVAQVSGEEIAKFYDDNEIRVLAGCAPCQRFSSYTQKRTDRNDTKWGLLYEFARLIEEVLPEIVTMENVTRLMHHKVYYDFVSKLYELDYEVTPYEVDCRKYGVPQTRKRLVLFASVFGKVKITEPTHEDGNYVTVREAIGHLERIRAGENLVGDPYHRAKALSGKNLERLKASVPGGTWRDWREDLVADCHKKETCRTYVSVYGRMEWDKPAPTITTQCCGYGNGRFGHPEQDRAISLREAALLQTFPERYEFCETLEEITFLKVAKFIGDAVPVKLGTAIARSILEHVEGDHAKT